MIEPLIIVGADSAGVCDVETGICAPAAAEEPAAEEPTVTATPVEAKPRG